MNQADGQKTSTVAAPDPFKPASATRVIGENKLLTARSRATPYAKPGQSKGKVNPYSNKCIDCKVSWTPGGDWSGGRKGMGLFPVGFVWFGRVFPLEWEESGSCRQVSCS